ncbi:FAD binding domain protein [Myxozyma melibiosi]|uniref:FAD binding domain protein n=1 Tax=Myxozyma melibiosi TaxID=54550 RepID=A0ABR1FAU4_9ASCO
MAPSTAPPAHGSSTIDSDPVSTVHTDFLVVGAGPAGAALACFLGSYGITGLMISAAPGTANTPRAHITNMAALDCLRDIGLDSEFEALSCKGEQFMIHTRWCNSMAGEEYARIYSWGNDPARKGEYITASPCNPVDLPQTLLEPVLVKHATQHGFSTRFNTSLLSFVEDDVSGLITATVRDDVSQVVYQISTKYLFGADGARSRIVKQLDFPLDAKPQQGLAINVLVKADLSHLVEYRTGNLHWVMQPEKEHPYFGWQGIVRMIKPWSEWMFILFPDRAIDPHKVSPSREEYLARVKDFIGDDTPAEIIDVSKWYINEIVATQYSHGQTIFCLGDAVHRHPPMNGLGSNTCIQDAFNLAWKLAYVRAGYADPSILETYSTERQPVGRTIITRANNGFRDHFKIWEALGTSLDSVEDRRRVLQELQSATPEGKKRREALRKAIQESSHEFHGLGVEMNQHYSSSCVYDADEPEPFKYTGKAAEDDVLYYEPTTYPGSRLPHVWLNKSIPCKPVSTIDLAGHGQFTLFTGIGGDAWKEAVSKIASVPIKAYSIGFRQDWEDPYFEWDRLRGVDETGCVLARPDRFIAWRAPSVLGSAEECEAKLKSVLNHVLGFSS